MTRTAHHAQHRRPSRAEEVNHQNQISRFAPGFRDCILARSVSTPAALEQRNPNLVGGDILGGSMNLRQLIYRPTSELYRMSKRGLYLCGLPPRQEAVCTGWLAIIQLTSHSQTWGVNAQLLLQSDSYEKSKRLHIRDPGLVPY